MLHTTGKGITIVEDKLMHDAFVVSVVEAIMVNGIVNAATK